MTMSPDEQIKKLQKSIRLSWMPTGLLVLTLATMALWFQTGYEIFFVISAFSGLAAAASRKAAPHLRNAIQATHTGTPSKGIVSIAITRDPTSFDDYVATVQDESKGIWRFEFSPYYWKPGEGHYKAQIYYVRGVDWPALLITEAGILFPAFAPERVAKSA